MNKLSKKQKEELANWECVLNERTYKALEASVIRNNSEVTEIGRTVSNYQIYPPRIDKELKTGQNFSVLTPEEYKELGY